MEQRQKKRGDRFDGYLLTKEVPALNRFMAHLMPHRTDCEAHMQFDIDSRPMDAYLKKKNDGLEQDKYTYFHLFLAAMVKCFVLRPKMNRFISGNRMYQRDHISVSFVVKKKFDDISEEGLAYKKYDENDTVDSLHSSIMQEIHRNRQENEDGSLMDTMDKLMSLPNWIIKAAVAVLFMLDRRGRVPYDLIKDDPNYSSIFLTNLGSIGMDCGYHHLNNWGTNSFFGVIGKRHMAHVCRDDGSAEVLPVISVGITLDERIADGFYYAGTIKLMRKLLENPELLEMPFSAPVEI